MKGGLDPKIGFEWTIQEIKGYLQKLQQNPQTYLDSKHSAQGVRDLPLIAAELLQRIEKRVVFDIDEYDERQRGGQKTNKVDPDFCGVKLMAQTSFDLLGWVLSVTAEPSRTATELDYYLPLLSMYAKWCATVAFSCLRDARGFTDPGRTPNPNAPEPRPETMNPPAGPSQPNFPTIGFSRVPGQAPQSNLPPAEPPGAKEPLSEPNSLVPGVVVPNMVSIAIFELPEAQQPHILLGCTIGVSRERATSITVNRQKALKGSPLYTVTKAMEPQVADGFGDDGKPGFGKCAETAFFIFAKSKLPAFPQYQILDHAWGFALNPASAFNQKRAAAQSPQSQLFLMKRYNQEQILPSLMDPCSNSCQELFQQLPKTCPAPAKQGQKPRNNWYEGFRASRVHDSIKLPKLVRSMDNPGLATAAGPLGPPKQSYTVDGKQYPMPAQHTV